MDMVKDIMPVLLSIVLIVCLYYPAILIIKHAFKKEEEDIISFREAVDLTGLPIIILYQGDKKFNFILDSGASISAFNMDDVEGVTGRTTGNVSETFGIEGNKQENQEIELHLYYNTKEFIEEFQVMDLSQAFGNLKAETGVKVHGILGSAFLAKYRYILDFDKMIAYQRM